MTESHEFHPDGITNDVPETLKYLENPKRGAKFLQEALGESGVSINDKDAMKIFSALYLLMIQTTGDLPLKQILASGNQLGELKALDLFELVCNLRNLAKEREEVTNAKKSLSRALTTLFKNDELLRLIRWGDLAQLTVQLPAHPVTPDILASAVVNLVVANGMADQFLRAIETERPKFPSEDIRWEWKLAKLI